MVQGHRFNFTWVQGYMGSRLHGSMLHGFKAAWALHKCQLPLDRRGWSKSRNTSFTTFTLCDLEPRLRLEKLGVAYRWLEDLESRPLKSDVDFSFLNFL